MKHHCVILVYTLCIPMYLPTTLTVMANNSLKEVASQVQVLMAHLVSMEVAPVLMGHPLASMGGAMAHPLVNMEGVMAHPKDSMVGVMAHPLASTDQVGRENMALRLTSIRVEDWHPISLEGS